MNKTFKIIIGIIIVIITISLLVMISSKIIFNIRANAEFYTIGDDKIPSITYIVGKREVSKITFDKEKNITTKIYEYVDIKNVQSDLDHYITELRNSNFVSTTSIDLTKEKGTISLACLSNDYDYIIIMDIVYDINSYTIKIKKGIGSITEF